MGGFNDGAIAAALLGAIATGLFGIIDKRRERTRRRESTLVALVSEIHSICQIIRMQRFLESHENVEMEIRTGIWDGSILIADLRSNYFAVFDALAPDLGTLKQKHGANIVRFYALCKSAIDSARPDGPATKLKDRKFLAGSMLSRAELVRTILNLGDAIILYPRKPVLWKGVA